MTTKNVIPVQWFRDIIFDNFSYCLFTPFIYDALLSGQSSYEHDKLVDIYIYISKRFNNFQIS